VKRVSETLMTLIIVAFLLNIGGFLIYAISLRKHKVVTATSPPLESNKPNMVQDQIKKSEHVAKEKKQKGVSGVDYEDWKKQKEELENLKNDNETDVDVDKISKALDELQYEKKGKVSKNNIVVNSSSDYDGVEIDNSLREKGYEIQYEETIEKENKEVLEALEENHDGTRDIEENKKLEHVDDEPFELLADMGARTLEEYPTKTNKQVSHDTHGTHEKKDASESKKDGHEQAKVEPKREIIDSVNIMEVEGEDEPEDLYDEIVVRHYEPYAYQPSSNEEEEVIDEEVDEEAELEKRIAYLAGEWTEDYIIQPKKKPNKKK